MARPSTFLCGKRPLRERFPNIFPIMRDKDVLISDILVKNGLHFSCKISFYLAILASAIFTLTNVIGQCSPSLKQFVFCKLLLQYFFLEFRSSFAFLKSTSERNSQIATTFFLNKREVYCYKHRYQGGSTHKQNNYISIKWSRTIPISS